ncbi:hypothetical protein NKDENANG_03467 [Candidatus Entotheonellaceae bacterium PAL068K]
MQVDFPGVTARLDNEALTLYSPRPLQSLALAIIGGAFVSTRYSLNRHVRTGYCHPHRPADPQAFSRCHGITEPFVGLITAARIRQTQAITLHNGGLTIAAVAATAGLSNPAAPGLSPPLSPAPGTINLMLLIDAHLAPAAMANAVLTATETKAQVLLAQEIRNPEEQAATGTSTDAIVVACTGRGNALPYAGPVTRVGWLIGCCVRTVLQRALA